MLEREREKLGGESSYKRLSGKGNKQELINWNKKPHEVGLFLMNDS